jgi:hypothetical protein
MGRLGRSVLELDTHGECGWQTSAPMPSHLRLRRRFRFFFRRAAAELRGGGGASRDVGDAGADGMSDVVDTVVPAASGSEDATARPSMAGGAS